VGEKPAIFQAALAILTGLLLVALAFGSGFVVASFQPRLQDVYYYAPHNDTTPLSDSLKLFQEAWDVVKEDFYGPLPVNNQRVYGAVRGLLSTLDDPYTVFIEPIPRQFEQDDLRGSYGGVGMSLVRNDAGEIVLSPFRDSPSARAGILEGDVLLAVDDLTITSEMDISLDIAAHIRGEIGSDVSLTIKRGTETLAFVVTREVIEIPSVTWRVLEQDPTLGYIHISSFTDRTAGELKEGLNELSSGNVQGLILDLRNNGGGLLQAAIDVADQFFDDGTILYENRRGQDERSYEATTGGLALDIPTVLLVNHGTASASEIVAGAIQDRDRGVLIGETTFGKGSVQLIFDLNDGSSLHVTAARWYTPDRHQLDGIGITPDVIIETDPNSKVDVQLERAIMFLQTGK
jgi:carboxyl-terminal processing protease